MLKVEVVHAIRHQVLAQKRSIRAVTRETGVSRNTARRYVRGAKAGERETRARPAPKRAIAQAELAKLLDELARRTAKKQQLTAHRLHELLGQRGVRVGYSLVKELFAEHRRAKQEVFIPLAYRPGDLALVDFFEVVVDVDEPQGATVIEDLHEGGDEEARGGPRYRVKGYLFLMRLPFSGIDVVVLYPRQDQTCFVDGHVRAFHQLGGVPTRIGYDNLKAAVRRHLVGSGRELQDRFAALAAHYGFDPCFARPYEGHDKGAVEARGKGFRLQRMTPIPRGATLVDVSLELQEELVDDAAGDADAATELNALAALPEHAFDARKHREATVTRRSLVKDECTHYSAPEHLAQTVVTLACGAFHVDIIGRDGTQTRHVRGRFGEKRVDYHHYLKQLSEKPQAVRQVAHLLMPQLGEPFSSTWIGLLSEQDEIDAARAFCRVLKLVNEVGKREAASRLVASAGSNKGLVALLTPSRQPRPAPMPVPAALDVDVQQSRLDVYDELIGEVA